LHVDYVDNCWILVALDGSMLQRFLHAGQAADPMSRLFLGRVEEDRWYVINQEDL